MAKLEYNQVVSKKTVEFNGDPHLVISSDIAKKDRQKASNTVRMKNLRTGQAIEKTLHQSDVLLEAYVTKREVKYLYQNKGEFWFCEPTNPKNRFSLTTDVIGDLSKYVVENSLVDSVEYDDKIMSINIPIKVNLKVSEAPEAVKGNTSSGATKEVVLETGMSIHAPMFINSGDIISINTETGSYSERVEKA